MSLTTQYLKFETVEFAAWIETSDRSEHSAYCPENILFYVKRGTTNFRSGEVIQAFPAPAFFLLRKNTLGFLSKSWQAEEGSAEIYAIVFKDEFLRNIVEGFEDVPATKLAKSSTYPLAANPLLFDFFNSLPDYFQGKRSIDNELALNKTKEALLGCIVANPDLIQLFRDYASPSRIHLRKMVNHHYHLGVNVEELALRSGRSLSYFYREFKKEFGETPHKWLMKRRLQLATKLLTTTNKSVSVICDEVGFKDLAHFSKRFKLQYGVSPSKFPRT